MSVPSLLTVKQLCEKHPAFAPGGVRWNIFHAKENGLSESGALIRHGRRVLIHEERFFNWIISRGRRSA